MWQEILTSIILSIVGVVISGVSAFLMAGIRSKIKNEKAAKIVDDAYRIVNEGVMYVYQTYVENLKGTDLWDNTAKENARQKAVEYINKNLSAQAIKFLEQNGIVLEEGIFEQIEISVQSYKK